MSKTIHIDIVSAESTVFSGTASLVAATGIMGELGITPGHAPLLTRLHPGQVRVIRNDGSYEVFYISGGLLEVQPNNVTVLADTAERAENLDEAKVLEAEQRARDALEQRRTDVDYAQASAQLAQATAQLHAIRKIRKLKKH